MGLISDARTFARSMARIYVDTEDMKPLTLFSKRSARIVATMDGMAAFEASAKSPRPDP
jgi:hypothetical protein